jgi:hypothetical protein
LLRDLLLEHRGWTVVSMPYWSINAAHSDADLKTLLAGELQKARESQ